MHLSLFCQIFLVKQKTNNNEQFFLKQNTIPIRIITFEDYFLNSGTKELPAMSICDNNMTILFDLTLKKIKQLILLN